MHTAICTFEDRAQAEEAAERLAQSGFDKHAIHVEHRHPDGSPMSDAEGRDHDVVAKFSFFERLFGAGKHVPHADKYSSAVERGLYVVIVEGRDEAEAERAQNVLHGMEAGDLDLVHRADQRPLREVVAERQATDADLERSFGTAREDMAPAERQPERAMASQGWGEQRKLEVVDDDKPIASPDMEAGDESDKPR